LRGPAIAPVPFFLEARRPRISVIGGKADISHRLASKSPNEEGRPTAKLYFGFGDISCPILKARDSVVECDAQLKRVGFGRLCHVVAVTFIGKIAGPSR
jgi:hypothetical protein